MSLPMDCSIIVSHPKCGSGFQEYCHCPWDQLTHCHQRCRASITEMWAITWWGLECAHKDCTRQWDGLNSYSTWYRKLNRNVKNNSLKILQNMTNKECSKAKMNSSAFWKIKIQFWSIMLEESKLSFCSLKGKLFDKNCCHIKRWSKRKPKKHKMKSSAEVYQTAIQ